MAGLDNVPGLRGYLAQQQLNRQAPTQELQQAQAAMGLMGALQKRQKEQEARAALSALGPEPSQEALTGWAAKYASPDVVLKTQQASLDRNAQLEAATTVKLQGLEQQKQYQDMMHQWRMAQAKTDEERLAETTRRNQAMEGIARQQAEINAELARLRTETQVQARQDRNVQALGTALERANLPEADAVLRGVEDSLKKAPELADYISGPKSLLPDITLPKQITDGKQAFQKLFNITLKNRSGAAVTIPEFERLKQEFATGVWKKPEQLKAGVEQARNIIQQHYRSIAAGYGPAALESYNENLRRSGGTPILESGAAPKSDGPPKVTSDADFDALPSGTVFIGPDGKQRRKP